MVSDLQARMLRNLAAGRAIYDGIPATVGTKHDPAALRRTWRKLQQINLVTRTSTEEQARLTEAGEREIERPSPTPGPGADPR